MNEAPFQTRFNLAWWHEGLLLIGDQVDSSKIWTNVTSGAKAPFKTSDGRPPVIRVFRSCSMTTRQGIATAHTLIKELWLGRLEGPHKSIRDCTSVSSIFMLSTETMSKTKHRLIYNLSSEDPFGLSINKATLLPDQPVPLATVASLCASAMAVGRDGWMFAGDLQDAYRQQHLDHSQSQAFGFRFRGLYYVNKVVPWGWNYALEAFAATSHAWRLILQAKYPLIFEFLHDYIDDFPGFCKKLYQAYRACRLLLDEAKAAGYIMNPDKILAPTRVGELLGLIFDLPRQLLRFAQPRILKYVEQIDTALGRPLQSVEFVEKLIGRLQWTCIVFTYGQIQLRPIRRLIYIATKTKSSTVLLSAAPVQDGLRYFRTRLVQNKGIPFRWVAASNKDRRFIAPEFEFYSDAAGKTGMGGVCGFRFWQQPWTRLPAIVSRHAISWQEALAALVCVLLFVPLFPGTCILAQIDNQAVVEMILSRDARTPHFEFLLRILFAVCEEHGVFLTARYIPTEINVFADALSRLFPLDRGLLASFLLSVPLRTPDLSRMLANVRRLVERVPFLPSLEDAGHILLGSCGRPSGPRTVQSRVRTEVPVASTPVP